MNYDTNIIKRSARKINKYLVFLICGVVLLIFGLAEINARRSISLEGIVIKSENYCNDPNPARYYSIYTIKSSNGVILTYHAYGNDHSLQRDLPRGTRVYKIRGSLDYLINDVVVKDFPIVTYSIITGIGASLAIVGILRVILIKLILCQDDLGRR